MSVDTATVHEKLQKLIDLAPVIKQLHSTDVAISISDTEKVVFQLDSSEFDAGKHVGRVLQPEEPMSIVMRNNKREIISVPEEAYGVALRVIVVPITDDNGKVIGSIGISTNRDNQARLLKVAEQFANSSEEINSYTEELASNSTNFNTYIKHLSEAQEEMSTQVENTTKILEMINAVAKNTRILGFNAGIEAARSGEYGRGFSVVAKEITKLADQSAESVNEIRNLLDQLKDKVDQVEKIVSQTVEISKNQSTSIEEIAQNINKLTEVADDIEEMAKEIL